MKYRILARGNGVYIPQYKKFLFWHSFWVDGFNIPEDQNPRCRFRGKWFDAIPDVEVTFRDDREAWKYIKNYATARKDNRKAKKERKSMKWHKIIVWESSEEDL